MGFVHFLLAANGLAGIATVFFVAMVVTCAVREGEERWNWLFLMLFLNVIGAAIYLFVRVVPSLGLRERFVLRARRRREIDLVMGDIVRMDKPHHWARLGKLQLEGHDHRSAEESLTKALAKEEDIDARFDLARAEIGLGKREAAIETLSKVIAKDRDHGYGDALRLYARTLVDVGRVADARPVLDELVRTRPTAEMRYLLAVVLDKQGERERAKEQVERIALEARGTPVFARRREAPWRRKAKALGRRL